MSIVANFAKIQGCSSKMSNCGIVAFCAAMLVAASAFGEVLVYEGFSSGYATGNINGKKPNAASIGLNTSTGWNSGTGVFVIRDTSLSVPNAWTASGAVRGAQANSVAEYNTGTPGTWIGRRAQYCAITCTWPSSGSLYFRFLMRVPAALVNSSSLGKDNYWMAGLGTANPSNPTANNAAPSSGVYFGLRNDNWTFKLSAYVQKGGESSGTWYDFATITPSTQLDCVCVAKIDIGTGGADTLSLYAVPTASWSDDFTWTHTVENANLVSGSASLSKLVMIGQYPTGSNDVVFDEFLVSTAESEAYSHVAPGAPSIGDVALSRTSAATYSISAVIGANAADVFWVADNGATAVTNDIQAGVAVGDTATGTISGLAADKTYRISVLAKNGNGSFMKEAGSIYTGELTLGATVDASEATLTAGTVEVSRDAADPFPLSVNYTITGTTGTQGMTWEAPVAVTIPKNETTGYLRVQPMADLGVNEDITVTATLASGNYEVKASPDDSQDLQILNSDTPTGYEIVTFTNAFDNPFGGYMLATHSVVGTSGFTVNANRIINFLSPTNAPSGLREYNVSLVSSDYITIESGDSTVTRDWMLFPSFTKDGGAGTIVDSIQYASTELSGQSAKMGVRAYSGSWYVPETRTYSFRMHMSYVGLFSLDGKLILRQVDGNAVVTNGVELTKGWHNIYAAFVAGSDKKIRPADSETCGLTFSASNSPSPDTPFSSASGCSFTTAFNPVLVPSMWAKGGDVIIDCANLSGDLRLTGQIGASAGYKYKFVNIPAGRTIEFGRPINCPAGTSGYQDLSLFAYADWTHVETPSGVNIRFEGGMVVDSTWATAGRTAYSLGNFAVLATDVPNFFGTLTGVFNYPSGLRYLHVGRPEVLGDAAEIHVPDNCTFGYGLAPFGLSNSGTALPVNRVTNTSFTFQNDVVLGNNASILGTLTQSAGSDRLLGSVSGSQGNVKINGWGRYVTLCGSVNVRSANVSQRGQRMNFLPKTGSAPSSISGTLWLSGEKAKRVNDDTSGWDYRGATFFYSPETPGEHPLSIGVVEAQDAVFYPENVGTKWGGAVITTRQGATLSTCSNNTINVTTLQGAGVHLRSAFPSPSGQGRTEESLEADAGVGNFVFGRINGADGSNPMKIFVSTNVNITVTNIAKSTAFHYEVMSNGVNTAVLDVEGTVADGTTITATDIAMLPARVKGFTGKTITLTDMAAGQTYPVVFDFDQKGGIPIGGCDGSGTLAGAPMTGTIDLSLAGTPRAGDWGILRFDSVPAGQFTDWRVINAPGTYRAPDGANYAISVRKEANGFSLHVSKLGMLVIIK